MAGIINFISSKYFLIINALILGCTFIQGKMASRYVVNGLDKIFNTRHNIVKTIIKEDIADKGLEDKYTEYYNCLGKSYMYLILGITSMIQIIPQFLKNTADTFTMSVSMMAASISFIEYRDNHYIYKKLDSEIKILIRKIIKEYQACENMATDDEVKSYLKSINRIE